MTKHKTKSPSSKVTVQLNMVVDSVVLLVIIPILTFLLYACEGGNYG